MCMVTTLLGNKLCFNASDACEILTTIHLVTRESNIVWSVMESFLRNHYRVD